MAILGLLLINEPSIGLTDRSNYLHIGDGAKTQFRNMIKQRGTASIELSILAGIITSRPSGARFTCTTSTQLGKDSVFSPARLTRLTPNGLGTPVIDW